MNAAVLGIRSFKTTTYETTRARIFQSPWHKLILLASVTLILAGALAAQNPESPGLRVAHPWDPSSPLSAPSVSVLSPQPLSGTNWTALGPAPISNGQRPGGGR